MGYLRCERERTMRRKGKKGERAYILKLRQDSSFIRMSFFFFPPEVCCNFSTGFLLSREAVLHIGY